jgi:predicted ATPase
MHLVQMSLVHGLSPVASIGLSAFELLLCNAFGDVDLGIQMAKLSLQVVDKYKSREWTVRVYVAAYGFCCHVQNLGTCSG